MQTNDKEHDDEISTERLEVETQQKAGRRLFGNSGVFDFNRSNDHLGPGAQIVPGSGGGGNVYLDCRGNVYEVLPALSVDIE